MENVRLGLVQMEYLGAPVEVVHLDPLTSQTKVCNILFHFDDSICYPTSLQ